MVSSFILSYSNKTEIKVNQIILLEGRVAALEKSVARVLTAVPMETGVVTSSGETDVDLKTVRGRSHENISPAKMPSTRKKPASWPAIGAKRESFTLLEEKRTNLEVVQTQLTRYLSQVAHVYTVNGWKGAPLKITIPDVPFAPTQKCGIGGEYLPGSIHHGEATEVPTGDSQEHSSHSVYVVVREPDIKPSFVTDFVIVAH